MQKKFAVLLCLQQQQQQQKTPHLFTVIPAKTNAIL